MLHFASHCIFDVRAMPCELIYFTWCACYASVVDPAKLTTASVVALHLFAVDPAKLTNAGVVALHLFMCMRMAC